MSYAKYPKEMKEAIIARMLEGDETVTDIQRGTGVGINTLYRWRDKAVNQKGLSATTKYKNADKWSSEDNIFDDGRDCLYDAGEDIKTIKEYEDLKYIHGLFEQVKLDESRTCVFWNDYIDLPSDTIYEYGMEIR